MKLFSIFNLAIFLIASNANAEVHTIVQKDKKFSTSEITVHLGDTLIFKNDEANITHNVYSITPGNEFELTIQKPKTSTPILIDPKNHQPGQMMVECAIHPGMKIKVTVSK